MTIAQQWEQEEIQKGMQQDGATLLKLLLQQRFGDLPNTYAQRIESSDAKTLDDIFNGDE